jgi:A/G-specific adenine glycosylase
MELGATVCRVGEPDCPSCPLRASCRAAASGHPSQFPELRRRPTVVARKFATVLWNDGQSWWMRQRGADEHNGGFWEFPQLELSDEADPLPALARWLGVPAQRFQPAGRRRHSITRYRITEEIFLLEWPRTARVGGGVADWFTARQVHDLPLTGAHRRLATEHVDNPQD